MSSTLNYPGVYIEEIPSGVRTITGVATSITAFLGRAFCGPINEPVTINSFGDFERAFGGLKEEYMMSYAVRDFYQNGGSQAVIVRLFKSQGGEGTAQFDVNGLTLEAVSPGTWGNSLLLTVDRLSITPEVAQRYNLPKEDLFNLSVLEILDSTTTPPKTKLRERVPNVSIKATSGPQRIDRRLAAESQLLRVSLTDGNVDLPTSAPGNTTLMPVSTKGTDSDLLDLETYEGSPAEKTGIHALDKVDLFNLLCIPPDTRGDNEFPNTKVYQTAMVYCQKRRAMLIVDAPAAWSKKKETAAAAAVKGLDSLALTGEAARCAALYFPRLIESDPNLEGQLDTFAPCGAIAGVMARTDATRGVWKAPAGLDASLNGIQGLDVNLTDQENGMLNPLGINCLRSFPVAGRVVWGARTLRGADQLADEYKYVPVRRLALFIEESLYRGTQWVVFEPNDEPLWSQIRLNLGAFMHNLFRQGAFQGQTPADAYFVKCDKETTPQNDINLGIVNIVVGFAPLKPAEFVVIKLQQMAGKIDV